MCKYVNRLMRVALFGDKLIDHGTIIPFKYDTDDTNINKEINTITRSLLDLYRSDICTHETAPICLYDILHVITFIMYRCTNDNGIVDYISHKCDCTGHVVYILTKKYIFRIIESTMYMERVDKESQTYNDQRGACLPRKSSGQIELRGP